jgi:hypothetical protein
VIDGFDPILVQPLDQITKERVHRVIAPARPLPIEPLDSLAGVLARRQLRFGVGDTLGGVAELPERLVTAVTVLVARRRRTRDEDVRPDIQRGDVSSGWRLLVFVRHRHRLMSPARIGDVVVGKMEVALFPVPSWLSPHRDA